MARPNTVPPERGRCDHAGEHCPAWPARVVLRDLGLAWRPSVPPEPVYADPAKETAFRRFQRYERRRYDFDAALAHLLSELGDETTPWVVAA